MIIVVDMIRETSAVVFRQNLGEMLNQVQYRHDSILINRDGKPVAALIDAALFERIRRLQARFEGLCARIEAGYADVPEAVLGTLLAAVRSGAAQALVTGDKDLLALRDRYAIVTPTEFWARHGGL